jgi:hypothetical protein
MSAYKWSYFLTLLSDPAHPFRCVAHSSELLPANSKRFTTRCDWMILSFGSNLAVQDPSDVSSSSSLPRAPFLVCVLEAMLRTGSPGHSVGAWPASIHWDLWVLFSTYIGDSPVSPARFSVAVTPQHLDCVSADAVLQRQAVDSLLRSYRSKRSGCPRTAKDVSPKKVRGHDAEKFSGSDNLGVLPKLWEMALVARH